MSLKTHRAVLAAAVDALDDVSGHERFVPLTDPGTAYPRLARIEYPNAFGGVVHWSVVVILPQEPDAAETWIEDHVDELREAIEPELVITTVVPQQLQTVVGVLPALFINGHRAEGE